MSQTDEKQCRICFDGAESGRLIRPCLCKGSISYVHVKCLATWRNSSANRTAFFSCPQCHYKYRFARTRVVGLATNPVIIAGVSTVLFTALVLLSSFVTTYFMSVFEEPADYWSYSSYFYVSPVTIAQDLVRAALRILRDEDGANAFDNPPFSRPSSGSTPLPTPTPRRNGLLRTFVRRFVLGLPIVGAGSLVHMLMSLPFLNPIHYLARYRSRRRDGSRDIASLVIVILLIVGAARALYKVYQITQSTTKRLLIRAEDAVLEVN